MFLVEQKIKVFHQSSIYFHYTLWFFLEMLSAYSCHMWLLIDMNILTVAEFGAFVLVLLVSELKAFPQKFG